MTTSTLSDRAVSYLRTAVPVVWGSLVGLFLGWVAPHLPGELGQLLADFLGGESALTFVVALAIAAWYAVWRRVEKRIPDWLTRIVLGSAAAPSYSPVVAVLSASGVPVAGPASDQPDGTPVVAGLTDHERVALARTHDTLPLDDPGRPAIASVLEQARHLA